MSTWEGLTPPYSTIVADPPWGYEERTPPWFSGSTPSYSLMPLDDVKALPVAAEGTWYTAPRGPHSAKPPLFADLIERMSPGPYVELFARAPRLGWDSWGNGYESGAA